MTAITMFKALSLDDAIRTLLAMLPSDFLGGVLIDKASGKLAHIYSVPGYSVASIEDLAHHLWAEAERDNAGVYLVRQIDDGLVAEITRRVA